MRPRQDLVRRSTEILEPESHLACDVREHDLLLGILKDGRDGSGELGRPDRARITAGDLDATFEAATVEVGNETRQCPQQRRLARSGRAEDGDQLSLFDLDRDVVERRGTGVGIRERQPFDVG